ncbi:Mini-ribonuclease 3 [Paenibacillus chitinolyticus]|uniref:Mini-ribonuclease 3 n=1 Tax=Paenibacillus chitinolyticus TaxID=79263 RepID=UPI001C46B3AA|nr:Mini-ribonuclease 3 [Paenibacillus chitinolyticus]
MNLSDKLNPQLFRYPPSQKPELLNPLVLAYIGDAVYEMFIRQYVISMPSQRPNHLHRAATRYVSAKAQSKALQALMPLLTEEEAGIVKRGRNAKSGSTAKNADVLEYRHSTAFESLIGYLYYKQAYERLNYIMEASLAPEKIAALTASESEAGTASNQPGDTDTGTGRVQSDVSGGPEAAGADPEAPSDAHKL